MRAEISALRRLRMARDLTQAQLADVLGMTQGELSRLEARSDSMLSTLRRVILCIRAICAIDSRLGAVVQPQEYVRHRHHDYGYDDDYDPAKGVG